MAPEVIACDKDETALYDEKVLFPSFSPASHALINLLPVILLVRHLGNGNNSH